MKPLALPSVGDDAPHQVYTVPAVALLVARIRDREPDFAVSRENAGHLAEICRRLDGLPLAIELAAARVRTLGCAAVAMRLSESTAWLHAMLAQRPERHQTLDAAIEWSYDLLNGDEQRLFCHLAPFAGGFDFDAVSAVATAIGLGPRADDLLQSLVEKSLVIPTQGESSAPRYAQLATIRAYAVTRLRNVGEETTAGGNFADLFLKRAIAAAKEMYGQREAEAHARLRADQANLHAALEWFVTTGDLAKAAQLAIALHRHWLLSARFVREIVARLESIDQGLESGAASVPAILHADLLKVLGSLSGIAGAHQRVPWGYFERAQSMYHQAGDRHGEALALNHLGWSSLLLGRHEDVSRYSSAAQVLHEERANAAGVAVSHVNLGWVALMRAEFESAEQHFAAALAIQESLGDQRATAYANGHLGTVALSRGDPITALKYFDHERMKAFDRFRDRVAGPTFELRRIVALHEMRHTGPTLTRVRDVLLPQLRESNHGWSLAFALATLARLLIDADDTAAACTALEEGQRVADSAGLVSLSADCHALKARASLRAARLDEAAVSLAASVAVRQQNGEPLGVIEGAEMAAEWLALQGRSALALSLLSGSAAARRAVRAVPLPRWSDWLALLEERVVAEMPADQVTQARHDSTALTWHELGASVLRELRQ